MRFRSCLPLAVLLCPLLAGCTSSAPEPSPDPSTAIDEGNIYIWFVTPRGRDDRFEFSIELVAPDGTVKAGTIGTHYEDYAFGWDHRLSGDVQKEQPGVLGPYPFVLFEDVQYNGSWTVTIARTQSSTLQEDLVGVEKANSNHCLEFAVGKPDRIPLDGALLPAPAVAFSHAQVFVTYPNPEVDVVRESDDTCADFY